MGLRIAWTPPRCAGFALAMIGLLCHYFSTRVGMLPRADLPTLKAVYIIFYFGAQLLFAAPVFLLVPARHQPFGLTVALMVVALAGSFRAIDANTHPYRYIDHPSAYRGLTQATVAPSALQLV